MGRRDARVDAYIEKSAEFARPILTRIRETVHGACPECTETIKWGSPHFDYKGMLCGMAAFKRHCVLNFWKGSLVFDGAKDRSAMGQFGRLASVSDLPPTKTLAGYVKKATALNENGVNVARKAARAVKPLRVPADLASALKTHARARAVFEEFSPSHKREYVEWITSAKRDDTRARRLATTIEWLAEGKSHNWRYEKRSVNHTLTAPDA